MKNAPRKIAIMFAAAILLLACPLLFAQTATEFLKGNVHRLDKGELPLEKRFELAEKEFRNSGGGEVYLTGYAFWSRHEFHTDRCWQPSKPYEVRVKDSEINLRRFSKWTKKGGEQADVEQGEELVGLLFLHRISKGKADIVDAQVIDLDHSYEFEDVPVFWLGDAKSSESLGFLEKLFVISHHEIQKTLVFVASLHQDAKAYDFLRAVALGKYSTELKKTAIFWLGNYKDEKSLSDLRDIYKKEKDSELKERVVFAFSLSQEKAAVEELIAIAKNETDRDVRKKAIFWLSQKASKESIQALKDVVEETEDVEVKNSAVFAISQLPKEKSVPMLIDIARTNKSASVRKKAIFWLGQTDSDEALKFFEEILLRK